MARLLRPLRLLCLSLSLSMGMSISGCTVSSPPIRYLQLSAGSEPQPEAAGLPVAVDAVAVPDYLLRDELLLRQSAVELTYSADQRWAEPLDLGIQRVLARRLARELNTRSVVLFPDVPRQIPFWELRVDVRQFEMRDDKVVLRANGTWTQRGAPQGDSATPAHVVFEAREALPASDADAAMALSRLLWQFAEALAEPLL